MAYRVYRGTASGSLSFLVETDSTAYTDRGLTGGATYYYHVSAANAAGEGPPSTEVSVVPITPDTTSPVIEITSPSAGATLDSTTVTIRGIASDNVAVQMVEVSMDGIEWVQATGTTPWVSGLILREGLNTIIARATDTSGNTATTSVSVQVVVLAPSSAPQMLTLVGGLIAASVALGVAAWLLRKRGKGRDGGARR